MTKHVLPEITGIELNSDYERPNDDGTITVMRETEPGQFVRFPRKSAEELAKEEAKLAKEEADTRPALSDNKPLDDVKETPKDISERFIRAEMAKGFDTEPSEEEAEADSEKDNFEETGKRSVKHGLRCNLAPSKRQAYYPRPTSECGAVVFDVCNHFRFRHTLVAPPAVNRFRCAIAWSPTAVVFDMHEQRIVVRSVERAIVEVDKFPLSFWAGNKEAFDISLKPHGIGQPINRWREEGMTALLDAVLESHPDIVETGEASESRARQLLYSITAPKNDSDVLPRKSRNVSPDEQWVIRAWAEYLRLNGSLVPLQTNFGKSDGVLADFPGDADSEGGERPEAKYPLDATLQNRPSVEELAASWPAEKHCEMRRTPVSRDCSHIMGPILPTREMKIPVSGKVDVLEYANDNTRFLILGEGGVLEYRNDKSKGRLDDADDSIAGYRQLYKERTALGTRPAHWPDPKRKTKKQIGVVRDRTAEQELGVAPRLLHISEVDKTRKWHFHRIGGLRFAPNGHLIKYATWYTPMVDVPRKAKGAEFVDCSADRKNPDDMARLGWEGCGVVHKRETRELELSGAEHAEQLGNKDIWEPCPTLYPGLVAPEPCRDLYHVRLRGTRSHPMPYSKKYEPLGRDYAFGKTYTAPEIPADDVVERSSQLAAVNAMLSRQGLLVANAIVKTELTRDLASSDPAIGALLWKGAELPSKSTLERNGKQAREDTEEELRVIFQKLAT
jgi:hypothetical protein